MIRRTKKNQDFLIFLTKFNTQLDTTNLMGILSIIHLSIACRTHPTEFLTLNFWIRFQQWDSTLVRLRRSASDISVVVISLAIRFRTSYSRLVGVGMYVW